ncbi:MAG: amidase family protein, partial [Sphingobium sp.]
LCNETGITPPLYTQYTMLVNLAGYCALSVPAGFVRGLPVGLQIIAPPDRENLLLRAARVLERIQPWADRRPEAMMAAY